MAPRQAGTPLATSGHSPKDLLGARLQVGDAGSYLVDDGGRVTDWTAYWVFDNGPAGPPRAADLIDQLASRQPYLTVLDRHIADVPGNVGNPYWVAGSSPLRERLRVVDQPTPWSAVLKALTGTFNRQLDLHRTPWFLTAYTDVRGAPTGPAPGDSNRNGSATVLMTQVSHTFLLGEHVEGMARAMFGRDPEPLRINRLGGTVDRPRPVVGAILGAAMLPVEYLRWTLRRVGLAMRPVSSGAPFTDRTPTAINAPLGDAVPVIRVIRPEVADARGRGLTVTNLALAAISLAVQRYLVGMGADCPGDLAALVMVRFDDPLNTPAVNKITAIQADLYPSIADPARRARAIQASARDRQEMMSRLAAASLRVGGSTPYPVVVRLRRRAEDVTEQRYCVTGVTSVRRIGSSADWALADRRFEFGGTLMNSGGAIGLGHSLVGGSTDLTVSIVADRDVITDIDEYARLLAEAFTEVTAAVGASDKVAR